ncbi:MAG TPA: proprotein convertase P-domain-containing protein [Kofleriaceae bacterium]|nr:proprotein convertase P-domain-containing protein [Kofleriaceae bacterium]
MTRAVSHPVVTATPQAIAPVAYAVSQRVVDLPPLETKPEGGFDEESKVGPPRTFRNEDPWTEPSHDTVVQNFSIEPTLADPEVSFDGLSNQNNAASFGFQVSPPDTNGDVGPNHYVQMTNLLVRVFNKSGVPLTQPFRLSGLFQPLGGQCAAEDAGDPVVLYDPLSDRWILSQFAFLTTAAPPYHECFAISQTPDPTGAYFLFDFVTPGANFPDYPKLGVWSDAYYMTTNQFLNGATFNGAGIFAFERAKMVAGDPTASMVYVNLDIAHFPEGIGGMLPADVDGLTPPPVGAPEVFSYFIADEFGDASDAVRMFDFHVDFAAPGRSTFVERAESPVVVAPFNPLTPAGRDDIEQPPAASAAAALDSISDRLMFRLAYRNFGDHESLVATHSVNVGTGVTLATHQSGVRYYELRRAPGESFVVADQATFAPDADSRWMPSGAMDHQGDLAIGYNVASLTTFPSMRYAGRLATDPAGGLFQGERSLVGGTGVQTSTGSRWGDYSALNVDPADDCTFWFTSEYYTASSQASSQVGWLTRIGRFRFPECVTATPAVLQGRVTNARTGAPIAGATVSTADGFLRFAGPTGDYSINMFPKSYSVTATAFGFRPSTVNVSLGSGTTIQNFALSPVAIIRPAGAQIVRESCSENGAIDPTETVRVKFALQNIGGADTDALEATLLTGGGVTRPSGATRYGTVVAGGPPVERELQFTADAVCGSTLTATLALRDAHTGEDFGTVAFPFTVGTLSPVTTDATATTGNLTTTIADVATEIVPIDVAAAGQIVDLDVRIRANHTFDGDLGFTLIGPDGTTVDLSSNNGGSGDNYGDGATDCTGRPTVFDDQAPNPIAVAAAPFAASFRPEQPLSRFTGRTARGTWRLQVSDSAALDTGTLFCVQLVFKLRAQLCCDPNGTPIIIADTSSLVRERFVPANGAADPGERVTYQFNVRNVGNGNTEHLKAELLDGNGVVGAHGQRVYGEVDTGGPPRGEDFQFTADGVCGATIQPTLALSDDHQSLGTVSFPIRLGTSEVTTASAAEPASIAINDTPRTGGFAVASPYPSTINVSGVTGTVRAVRATINGFSHTFPADVDILLVGPQGQQVILLSDAGGGTDAIGLNLTFDDAAAATAPGTLVSGTFKPTNIGTGDIFPGAPPGAPASALATFAGTDPNGAWRLFVVDDAGADLGSIAGGWSLSIDTEAPVCVAAPPPGDDDGDDGEDDDGVVAVGAP